MGKYRPKSISCAANPGPAPPTAVGRARRPRRETRPVPAAAHGRAACGPVVTQARRACAKSHLLPDATKGVRARDAALRVERVDQVFGATICTHNRCLIVRAR